jgi:hypothetical protein
MIAPIRPPEKSPRSTIIERARRFLATTLLPPGSEEASKAAPAAVPKAWLFAGLLIAIALWCGFVALVAMF